MLDISLAYRSKAKMSKILNNLKLKRKKYILCTIHRQSNIQSKTKLKNVIYALSENKETVVIPAHPRTRNVFKKYNITIPSNIILIQPLGYIDMLSMISNSRFVVTDSGGVQKESSFFNVPCLVLREETEWSDLVDNGYSILVGTSKEKIKKSLKIETFNNTKIKCFGDGSAGKKIVKALVN